MCDRPANRKQRLWEKEVGELKRLYATKLRQVSQQAQRSQRSLQLQLYKTQQEKARLQEELDSLRTERSQDSGVRAKTTSPTLEETQWEVCQKSGEISLLKQQLKDSQAEVTQKLSEIFHLKTELREARSALSTRESQIQTLKMAADGTPRRRCFSQTGRQESTALDSSGNIILCSLNHVYIVSVSGGSGGPTEERLRAELLLERRQSEAQALAFEEERQTWQAEKDKVIRYQKELQTSYLDMYHRNEDLERKMQQMRACVERDRADSEGAGQSQTLEHDVSQQRSETAAANQTDRSSSGLPWIDRIESSEI
uniref:Uncharacterized protein n=1 Tax=Periophthalmus magnuspinnatus TaxID=409849 RepID=A0A3B4AEA8_9GOBI